MVQNEGNIQMLICPSRNENLPTVPYKGTRRTFYHAVEFDESIDDISQSGLKPKKRFVFMTPDKKIALKFGLILLKIDCRGLDLEQWLRDPGPQVLFQGVIDPKRIKVHE